MPIFDRRQGLIILGMLAAFTLAACGGKTPKPKPATTTASADKKELTAKTRRPPPPPPPPRPPTSAFQPDQELKVCPKIKVTNRPKTDKARKILVYKPFVKVGKVNVAVAPQKGACLTSGFGKRRGRPHRGVDYQGKPPPMIHAAAPGTVLEALYRKDYGNVVLIDHGDGVFTRYAHLKNFKKGIKAGAKVIFGTPLGVMGKTSAYNVALHLHYEVLTGNYDTPKKSFGLKAVNIMALLAKQ